MAKRIKQDVQGKNAKDTPSLYGSHSSMLVPDATEKLEDADLVVVKDNSGEYITQRKHLDSGLADPNRYHINRKSCDS
jgi:hypothetical protein